MSWAYKTWGVALFLINNRHNTMKDSEISFNQGGQYLPDMINDIQEEVDMSHEPMQETSGRMRRVGQFMLNLPEKMYEATQKAVITARHDPVFAMRRTVEVGLIGAQLTPANEFFRFSAIAASIVAGNDPMATAAIGYGTALAIESSAAVAGASFFTSSQKTEKVVDWFNTKLEQRGIPKDVELSGITKTAIALIGGTAILQAVKYREKPNQSTRELRNFGLKASVGVAGVTGVQGFLIANSIYAPGPDTIGAAVAGVAGSIAGVRWAKKQIKHDK
jgi:hypothetical protein